MHNKVFNGVSVVGHLEFVLYLVSDNVNNHVYVVRSPLGRATLRKKTVT